MRVGSRKMKKIEVYGLQRSGTNYLVRLLEENLYVRVVNNKYKEGVNWKHSLDYTTSPYPKIFIHKPCMTWVESICDRNYVDYLKTQTRYPANIWEEGLMAGKNQLNIKQLTRTWCHWMNEHKPTDGYLNIDYLDLLDTPEFYVKYLAVKHDLRLRDSQIKTEFIVSQSKDFNRERYLGVKETIFTAEQLEIMRKVVKESLTL